MLISKKRYNAMLDLIAAQHKTIRIYKKQVQQQEKAIRILSNNVNSRADIIFPNTDERGLGETDTPDNLSDILSI